MRRMYASPRAWCCSISRTIRSSTPTAKFAKTLNSGHMDAPLLHSIENITHPAQYQALRRFYAGPAAGFKIYLDDACALPSDWKAT